jgi:hypothetical protein
MVLRLGKRIAVRFAPIEGTSRPKRKAQKRVALRRALNVTPRCDAACTRSAYAIDSLEWRSTGWIVSSGQTEL